jgi:hypothetical protein
LRHSSIRILTAIACLLFATAAWMLGAHWSSTSAAQAQTAGTPTARPPVQPAVSTSAQSAQLQPASASIPKNAKLSDIPALQPAARTEIYTAKRGEAIPTIARRYLSRTSYLTSSELAAAIRHANGDRTANILKANENIVIPGILSAPITEKTIPVAKDFEVRAIYLTGVMAGSDHGLRIIRHWREVDGNAVVFDIKDSDGSVSIPFEHHLVGKHNVYIHDVAKLVRFIHQQNMHAIARIAIFRDERLVTEHPELAVQSRRSKQPWRENGKLVWTDPSNPKVQDYNIALAKYVAQLGADEIQFDYVRFPAEGDQKDALFQFQSEHPEAAQAADQQDSCVDGRLDRPAEAKQVGTATAAEATAGSSNASSDTAAKANSPSSAKAASGPTSNVDSVSTANATSAPAAKRRKSAGHGASRGTGAETQQAPKGRKTGCSAVAKRGPQRTDVITAFLRKAYAEIHPTGALFSLDVFGVMAWQRQVDLSHTGQDIVGMAKYCDVLSPMIYPSHFFGMDKIARPGDAPEHFIGESMDRFELITEGSGVVIRPWLQAFHWRTKTYSPEYIKVQVETARTKGGIGFLFWNAANDYSKPFTAMPEMKAADQKDASKPKYFRGDELPGAPLKASLAPVSSAAAASAGR